MKWKYIAIVTVVLAMITSCSKDNSAEIQDELQVYFDRFVEEGEKRGKVIDISELNISGYVEQITIRGTLGQCKTYANESKSVVIDETYWNSASASEKEYVVFHELGHCALDRSHDNTKLEDGTCGSIMQSGVAGCQGVYNDENREQLLDELFSN